MLPEFLAYSAQTASIALVAAAVPGTLTLAVWVAGAAAGRLRRGQARPSRVPGKTAIVVPAHNEQALIGETVGSLLASAAATRETEVVVIADHCSDETAARALRAGARVLERNGGERGKGAALRWAFDRLMAEEAAYDLFLVVDGDSTVDAGFAAAMRDAYSRGADAIQGRYLAADAGRSWRTRLMQTALRAVNVLRPMGREGLGFSCGIVGNGFGLSRTTLERVPYAANSIVEDLEYHLDLVAAGVRVRYRDDARIFGEMPEEEGAALTQRRRWEGGRLAVAVKRLPGMLAGAFRGQPRFVEPALDLMLPPLAYLAMLPAAACALSFSTAAPASAAVFAVVAAYAAAALVATGAEARDALALIHAPRYVAWKLLRSRAILSAASGGADWERTPRSAGKEGAVS
jgi:cellulose synthase/poly-beta-1,6-N-acetylglucosamine synthase-like glycosyltransferase